MAFELTATRREPEGVDATVEWVFSDGPGDQPEGSEWLPWDYLAARGFEAKVDQVAALPASTGRGAEPSPLVRYVVGLGNRGGTSAASIRRAGALVARTSRKQRRMAIRLPDALGDSAAAREAAAKALAEGLVLGAYQFDRYKSDPEPPSLETVYVVGGASKPLQRALDSGARVGSAVCLARDLVNEPGGELTPARVADLAVTLGAEHGFDVEVLDEKAIRRQRLGGLLGVNRGSEQPPRFVTLRFCPAEPRGSLALVGKGITFDTGGVNVKGYNGMLTMKSDMAGAAAVLAAFTAFDTVSPKVKVTGYLPLTDNMSGGDATRPGDVVTARNGKTVEILNTDAEGRLVLADALSLASEAAPDAVLDLATLTGSVETALGPRIAALLADDASWAAQVAAAAERAGERVWQLPLPDDYRSWLDSDVADLRNVSRVPKGGTITAALFLREFAGGIPWAHLDIAGTAWSDSVEGEVAKGGTGFGVRLLLDLVRSFRKP